MIPIFTLPFTSQLGAEPIPWRRLDLMPEKIICFVVVAATVRTSLNCQYIWSISHLLGALQSSVSWYIAKLQLQNISWPGGAQQNPPFWHISLFGPQNSTSTVGRAAGENNFHNMVVKKINWTFCQGHFSYYIFLSNKALDHVPASSCRDKWWQLM